MGVHQLQPPRQEVRALAEGGAGKRTGAARLPRSHRKPGGRFADIFLDEEEGKASSTLSDELQGALRKSANLIVICSPLAVASDYAADEIRYFKTLGPDRRIVCLIVAGEANATDAGKPKLDDQPVFHKQSSVAGWRSRFDVRGNGTERVYLGLDGQPTLNKHGSGGPAGELR